MSAVTLCMFLKKNVQAILHDLSIKYLLMLVNVTLLQLDDVNGQLELEMDNKNQMERETRNLQMELNSLRAMDKTYAKLERAKRKVEEEFSAYKVTLLVYPKFLQPLLLNFDLFPLRKKVKE